LALCLVDDHRKQFISDDTGERIFLLSKVKARLEELGRTWLRTERFNSDRRGFVR